MSFVRYRQFSTTFSGGIRVYLFSFCLKVEMFFSLPLYFIVIILFSDCKNRYFFLINQEIIYFWGFLFEILPI